MHTDQQFQTAAAGVWESSRQHPAEYGAGFGSAWADSYNRFTRSITGEDVLQELGDVADVLAKLVREENAEAIGKVVLAVMSAQCHRWADRENNLASDGSRNAVTAAVVALMGVSARGAA